MAVTYKQPNLVFKTLYRIESGVAVAKPEGKREAPRVDTAGAVKMVGLLRG